MKTIPDNWQFGTEPVVADPAVIVRYPPWTQFTLPLGGEPTATAAVYDAIIASDERVPYSEEISAQKLVANVHVSTAELRALPHADEFLAAFKQLVIDKSFESDITPGPEPPETAKFPELVV